MTLKLNELQLLVVKHYDGGEFSRTQDYEDLEECGDTLLKFLAYEAQDAESNDDFIRRIDRAGRQLRDLIRKLSQEPI